MAESPELQTRASALTEATTSVTWVPGKNDGNDIWPLDRGITSTQVMIKRGPDRSDGPTFLAFVVWNGSVVGKILRVRVGSDGADFRQVVSNITAARSFGTPDFSTSSTGSGGGGGYPPTPHPNVDGECSFSPSYLKNVRSNAVSVLSATTDFMNYSEAAAAP